MTARKDTIDQLALALERSTAGLGYIQAMHCAASAWDAAERIHAAGRKVTTETLADALRDVVRSYMPTLPPALQTERCTSIALVIVRRFVPTITDPGPAPRLVWRQAWPDNDITDTHDGWHIRKRKKRAST